MKTLLKTTLKTILLVAAFALTHTAMAKSKKRAIKKQAITKKFSLEKLTSSKKLSNLKGKPVVLELFASWCNACAPSMRSLSKWHRGKRKSRFVPLSVDESKSEAHAFFKRKGMAGYKKMAYFDKNADLTKQIKFRGLPATIILDKNHRVVETFTGKVDGKKLKQIHKTLSRLRAAN